MLRPWKLEIYLNFNCETPIYLQIVNAITSAITSGKLLAGSALPGSRKLSNLLQVNRNTVIKALDILIAEGWLVPEKRKGVFVNSNIPDLQKPAQTNKKPKPDPVTTPLLDIVFDDGIPDSKIAPMEELARSYRRVFNQKSRWKMMGYGCEKGAFEFREALVQMLNFKRGLAIGPENLCITRGSQMAMYLLAQVLFQPGDTVIVENPGYRPAWSVFENFGAKILPIKVDALGLNVDEVERQLKKDASIKAVFVTPHHHYPTTVTLSLERRLQLLKLSNTYGFFIIEDDYDHEFHFSKRPILPISSYQEAQRVIYIGSMSKVVAPALRIGYIATTPNLIERIAQRRKLIDVQGDIIMELAILDLIRSGEVRRHLKRATTYYETKRDVCAALIKSTLSEKFEFRKPNGGLAFWIEAKMDIDILGLREKLLSRGVELIHPSKFSSTSVNGFRLGYASLSKEKFSQGLEKIAQVLDEDFS
ncbi:MAG: PLP-dependent aminotransferase family protein [Bacteroidota bacterium]